jgi:hypothetical protein
LITAPDGTSHYGATTEPSTHGETSAIDTFIWTRIWYKFMLKLAPGRNAARNVTAWGAVLMDQEGEVPTVVIVEMNKMRRLVYSYCLTF